MKVFVAGASGTIGRRLVPALRAAGHEVLAMTRSDAGADALRAAGAVPVVADALDRPSVERALAASGVEVVIHQLTSLAGLTSLRNFDAEFAMTNRLRTEGTDNLLAAARAAGVRRFIAQSYGNWIYERAGSALKTEVDRLDPDPPARQRRSLEAIRHLEDAVTGSRDLLGIALRYGSFYGPGTNLGAGGDVPRLVRQRKVPVIGDGAGIWSFIHIDDAASAAVAAVINGARGVYNVCDDDPAPVSTWLPELARALDAAPPRRVPTWLGRLAAGEAVVSMMTRIRGMSNEKAKRELGWTPRYPSWREGFRTGLG